MPHATNAGPAWAALKSVQQGVTTRKCSECTTSGTNEERHTAVPSELQPTCAAIRLRNDGHFQQAGRAGSSGTVGSAGPIVIEPSGQTTTQAMTQGFATGELWGINSQVFRTHPEAARGEPQAAIGTISAEKIYVRTLPSYVAALRDELKMHLPYTVELGAVGLKGCYLGLPSIEFPNGSLQGPIGEAEIVRRYSLETGDDAEIMNVLRLFFDDLYDLVAASREDVLTEKIVVDYRLPPRKALSDRAAT